jgi:pimeloyl-ACP methyl ester carboxylesterase
LAKDNPNKWKTPVDIIYGELSVYFNEQDYQRAKLYFPGLERENCHKIEQAVHWVQDDNLDQFCLALDRILSKSI